VQGIIEHALESAAINNSHPLNPRNTATYQQSGRPKRFTEKQINRLIKYAIKSKPQRLKSWLAIARELGFKKVSRTAVDNAFKSRGYGRYKVSKKPFLSEAMKKARYDWALKHKTWPCGSQYPPNIGFNRVL
jgi:hypothetical protein